MIGDEGVAFEEQEGVQTVNLADVEDDGFEVLPRGIYDVVVDEALFKHSDNSGNPMFSLTLVIESGEYEGRKLFTHVVFSPKTLGMAKRTMKRFGLEGELDFSAISMTQETADLFVGKRARAKIAIEKYEGEDTNRVKGILPAGEGGDDFLSE